MEASNLFTVPTAPVPSPSPYLCIETTSYGGRGFFASQDIPQGTAVLECATPLSSVVFRQYKKDTCSYCMKCDFHKACKVKLDQQKLKDLTEKFQQKLTANDTNSHTLDTVKSNRDFSKLIPKNAFASNNSSPAFAGLFFCSEDCATNWLSIEDTTGIVSLVLNIIDQAVQACSKSSASQSTESIYGEQDKLFEDEKKTITKEYVQQRWDECMLKLDSEGPSSIPRLTHSSDVSPSAPATPNIPATPIISALESPTESGKLLDKVTAISIPVEKIVQEPFKSNRKQKKAKKIALKLSQEEHDIARFVSVVIVKEFLKSNSLIHDSAIDDGAAYFESLQSNELLYLSKFPWMLSSHLQVYNFLYNTLPTPILPSLTPDLFRSLLGRDAANAFGIWQLPVTSESELLGSSLYPLASFFNHSCSHSIDKVRKGRTLGFVTNKNVKKGDQLYINYGMYSELPRSTRQETLKDQWFFECMCDKCEGHKE